MDKISPNWDNSDDNSCSVVCLLKWPIHSVLLQTAHRQTRCALTTYSLMVNYHMWWIAAGSSYKVTNNLHKPVICLELLKSILRWLCTLADREVGMTSSDRGKQHKLQQVLPKVIWKELIANPHGRECTRLLPGTWTPSNTPILRLTPLTTPNDSSIGSYTFAQIRNTLPIAYNGMLQIHLQNCLFPLDDHHPHVIHSSLNWSHSPPPQTTPESNQRFATIHILDRQTNRHTDRHME